MPRTPAIAGVGGAHDQPGSPDGDAMARVHAADVNEHGLDRGVLHHPAAGRRRGRGGWPRCCIRGGPGAEGYGVGGLGVGWHGFEWPTWRVGQDRAGYRYQRDNRDEQ